MKITKQQLDTLIENKIEKILKEEYSMHAVFNNISFYEKELKKATDKKITSMDFYRNATKKYEKEIESLSSEYDELMSDMEQEISYELKQSNNIETKEIAKLQDYYGTKLDKINKSIENAYAKIENANKKYQEALTNWQTIKQKLINAKENARNILNVK